MRIIHSMGHVLAVAILGIPALANSAPPATSAEEQFPYAPNEPIAGNVSLAKSADYLDRVAQLWMQPNACGGCHTNYSYLMARPLLKELPTPVIDSTRLFIQKRALSMAKNDRPMEVVTAAFGLASYDAQTGRLQSTTRQVLSQMWAF